MAKTAKKSKNRAIGPNERNTENVVRDQLRALDYYSEDNRIQVEEQKSNIASVKRLLAAASKRGKGGKGAPEFIITSPEGADFVLIIECKAKVSDHASAEIPKLLEAFSKTPKWRCFGCRYSRHGPYKRAMGSDRAADSD
jgi:hypothetical protein